MGLKKQVTGLNEFLTSLFGIETRLSTLLGSIGYDPEQIETLRNKHLNHIVTLCMEHLRRHIETGKGGQRQYKILCRRFGFDGKPPETLRELGRQLGISRERVRQLEVKGLRKYRHPAHARFLKATLRNIVVELGFSPTLPIDDNVINPLDPKAHEKWNTDDDADLRQQYDVGSSIAELARLKNGVFRSAHELDAKTPVADIAERHGRSLGGIRARLKRLSRIPAIETNAISEANVVAKRRSGTWTIAEHTKVVESWAGSDKSYDSIIRICSETGRSPLAVINRLYKAEMISLEQGDLLCEKGNLPFKLSSSTQYFR